MFDRPTFVFSDAPYKNAHMTVTEKRAATDESVTLLRGSSRVHQESQRMR
jgi:hypothetical protein